MDNEKWVCQNNSDCLKHSSKHVCRAAFPGSLLKFCESCNINRNKDADDCKQAFPETTTSTHLETSVFPLPSEEQDNNETIWSALCIFSVILILILVVTIAWKLWKNKLQIKHQLKKLFTKRRPPPIIVQEDGYAEPVNGNTNRTQTEICNANNSVQAPLLGPQGIININTLQSEENV